MSKAGLGSGIRAGMVRCQVVPGFNRRIFFGKSTPFRVLDAYRQRSGPGGCFSGWGDVVFACFLSTSGCRYGDAASPLR